ncbi:zinc-binding dehydrogenase [Treponema primitia]|uniref:zinc-dependent alcohol dehydrogenase n=1 Tax=Treponema primitia TaxID=88058 RepID=UPI003980FC0B
MKALYYIGDKAMEMRDIPKPEPKAGEYLIKVRANGICGSDFEGYMGKTGRRIPPMIMGHEVSGVIEETPANGKYKKGQSVVIFPKPFCGVCEYCKAGMVNVCPEGICMGVMDVNGSMTEYIAQEEKYLLPFAETLSFNEASMTEPLAVAYRSVHKISQEDINKAKYCMVVGAGTIGLLIIALLKLRGAKNLIVSDASAFRLDIAKKLGAEFTINAREGDFLDHVKEITGGKLCDYAFEAVGIAPTAANSLACLKIGGTVVWVGNAQKIVEVNMQQIVTTELTIKGNYVYDFEGFIDSLKLLEKKSININALMTNTYSLDEGVQAFKDLENNRDGKMIKVFLES